jgi:hypothetical protein
MHIPMFFRGDFKAHGTFREGGGPYHGTSQALQGWFSLLCEMYSAYGVEIPRILNTQLDVPG